MLMTGGGGAGTAMYAVQIESLEEFQKKLTAILLDLEANNNVMCLGDGAGTYGNFPEAQSFAAAYEQTKQDLITTFEEVTQLVNTMISVAGANAAKYKQTEADITAQFNAILQQYGDAPTTGTTSVPGPAAFRASAPVTTPGAAQGANAGSGSSNTTRYAIQSNSTAAGANGAGSGGTGGNPPASSNAAGNAA
jgi:hypothetical protein